MEVEYAEIANKRIFINSSNEELYKCTRLPKGTFLTPNKEMKIVETFD
jgi:hypothetical protein